MWEGHSSRAKAGESHHQWPGVEELRLRVLHLASLVKRSCFQLAVFSVYCIGSLSGGFQVLVLTQPEESRTPYLFRLL